MDNKVYKFADDWIDEFEMNGCYEIIENPKFSEGCQELGFEIDMGEKLLEDFPNEKVMKPEWMKSHADKIDDIKALGNAIYSNWRWFGHGAYSVSELDKNDNREWFITALNRLKELAEAE